eukprot:9429853-Pyramimonas_sp.AAC.1
MPQRSDRGATLVPGSDCHDYAIANAFFDVEFEGARTFDNAERKCQLGYILVQKRTIALVSPCAVPGVVDVGSDRQP